MLRIKLQAMELTKRTTWNLKSLVHNNCPILDAKDDIVINKLTKQKLEILPHLSVQTLSQLNIINGPELQ